jgi:hypothetical protein
MAQEIDKKVLWVREYRHTIRFFSSTPSERNLFGVGPGFQRKDPWSGPINSLGFMFF